MPNTPGATLISSFIEVISAGEPKFAVDATLVKGGAAVVATFSGLSTVNTDCLKAGMGALVLADEMHGGAPTIYALADLTPTWTFRTAIGGSSNGGDLYTFSPQAQPDSASEAALIEWLATALPASTVNLDFSASALGGMYTLTSAVDLNGATITGANGPQLTVDSSMGGALRNIGRIDIGVQVYLLPLMGIPALYLDDPNPVLLIDRLAGLSIVGGAGPGCALSGQGVTIYLSGGYISGAGGQTLFDVSGGMELSIYAVNNFVGTTFLNTVSGDSTNTVSLFIDSSFAYPPASYFGSTTFDVAILGTAVTSTTVTASSVVLPLNQIRIPFDSTVQAIVAALPQFPPDGYEITIFDAAGVCGINSVSVQAQDGSLIQGESTLAVLTSNWQAASLVFAKNMNQWFIL